MKAVIVGTGIIGLCSAYYLQQSGWEVELIEKNDGTDNCSFGNAGFIVPSHFTPLASPGIVAQGVRWMFDSKSPFYVKPAPNWQLIQWGYHFLRKANRQNVEHATTYLRDLNLLSHSLYKELAVSHDFSLEEKGIINYFKTQKKAEEENELAIIARELGLDAETLTIEQVKLLEPGLELDILGAVHYRCDAHLYPPKLMDQLKHHIISHGGHIHFGCMVTGMEIQRGEIKKLLTSEREYVADVFVIAGGAWLSELTKMARLNIPLIPGKGYSITEKKSRCKTEHTGHTLRGPGSHHPDERIYAVWRHDGDRSHESNRQH